MKIGLLSDVHAAAGPLREALALLRSHEVERLLCAGDVAGYGNELEETVALLQEAEVQVVLGNHDLWWWQRYRYEAPAHLADYFGALPAMLAFSVAGTIVCLVHASPLGHLMEGIRLLDDEGMVRPEQRDRWCAGLQKCDAEVLVVGHTHQVFAERLGASLVVNPGSTLFNHTCAILHLPERRVDFLALPGKSPVPSWNWGMAGGP